MLFTLALFVSFFFQTACEDEDDDGGGADKGLTNDVGDSCYGLCKDDLWCFDSNLATCVSMHCVGQSSGDMYCTQLCETADGCPDGFACALDCELDSSGQPYCVKDEDYQWLQVIGKCE